MLEKIIHSVNYLRCYLRDCFPQKSSQITVLQSAHFAISVSRWMCAFYRLVIPLQNIFHDFYLLFVTLPVTIWTWAEVTCPVLQICQVVVVQRWCSTWRYNYGQHYHQHQLLCGFPMHHQAVHCKYTLFVILWSMLHLEYSIMLIFSQVIKVNRSFKFLMHHLPSTI